MRFVHGSELSSRLASMLSSSKPLVCSLGGSIKLSMSFVSGKVGLRESEFVLYEQNKTNTQFQSDKKYSRTISLAFASPDIPLMHDVRHLTHTHTILVTQ